MRIVTGLVAVTLAACATGAPPAFPSGDRWTFPIVGTLEGGQLIVPVYVQDAGPYLMVIDPDTDATVIDDQIAKQLGVPTGKSADILDEADVVRHRYAAEVKSLRLGNLTVGRQYYYLMKAGAYRAAGREIRGVIGRDLLSDLLAFGYDRERGLGYLVTQAAFQVPAGATEVPYSLYDTIDAAAMKQWDPGTAPGTPSPYRGTESCGNNICGGTPSWTPGTNADISGRHVLAQGRRVVIVRIGDLDARVHLDLGAPVSQLRRSLWAAAGLAEVAAAFDLRDEAGTVRHVTGGGVAETVTIGGVAARPTAFAPYDDKRWDPRLIDGTVGLDALRGENVWVNWNRKRFYLVPRGDLLSTAKERIGRWQSTVLDRCAAGGCARIRVLKPTAPPPADPAAPTGPADPAAPGTAPVRTRVVMMIERDAATTGSPLELVLAPVTADGALAPLPLLVVNLAAGVNDASTQLGADYDGVELRVVDASPFPRACPGTGGCIDSIVP